ncbi:hypothetical protein Tco_0209477, partial [Tanacetum coccineum]
LRDEGVVAELLRIRAKEHLQKFARTPVKMEFARERLAQVRWKQISVQ